MPGPEGTTLSILCCFEDLICIALECVERSPTESSHELSTPSTLKGKYVTLELLVPAHIPLLFAGLGLPQNNHIVNHIIGFPHVKTVKELSDYLLSYLRDTPDLTIYVIKSSTSHLGPPSPADMHTHTDALGLMGYRLNPRSRVMKWDDVIYAPALRHSYAGTEAHFIMLCHLFESQTVAYQRLWLTSDAMNTESRRHTERLGYVYEGTLRKDNITRFGVSRNSDVLRMLDEEWPITKKLLRSWLRADNFDANGKQIRSLQEVRNLQKKSLL
jgi:hypothetical protein